jgi:hypothetical protein
MRWVKGAAEVSGNGWNDKAGLCYSWLPTDHAVFRGGVGLEFAATDYFQDPITRRGTSLTSEKKNSGDAVIFRIPLTEFPSSATVFERSR